MNEQPVPENNTITVQQAIRHLIQNVVEGKCSEGFFGIGRDDEIGELARAIQNASSERLYQAHLSHAVNNAAVLLLEPSGNKDFEASLLEGMNIIGRSVNVDRIRIWRNRMVLDQFCYVLQHGWPEGGYGQGKQIPIETTISYSDTPEWGIKFSKGECVNGPVTSLSLNEQNFLKPYEIQSILIIPVHLEDQFWGFVSFSDCHKKRFFTEDEINILRSGSLMMVSAVNRNEQAKQLLQMQKNTQALLDAMPMTMTLWSRDNRILDCTEESVKYYKMNSKQELFDRFFECSPKYQPDGQLSRDKAVRNIKQAFEEGRCEFEWMHQAIDGTPLPSNITLVRIEFDGEHIVAGYARDLRESRQMVERIEQRDRLLHTANSATTSLLSSANEEKFESSLSEGMEAMAHCINADRVYILKNETIDGELFFVYRYAWVNDAGKQGTTIIKGSKFPYSLIPDTQKIFMRGECIYGPIPSLLPDARDFFSRIHIHSILVVPVFIQDHFWGLVSFSDCREERSFTEDEINILRSGSLMMASAVNRNMQAAQIQAATDKLEAVIANYPGIIWCVNKDNRITLFNGRYLNELGLTSDSFENRDISEALNASCFFSIQESIQKTFTDGPQDINTEVDDKVYRIRTTLLCDNTGAAANVMGNFDDITERTRLQNELKVALKQARDANNAKTNFLANMSHEMRTPLNAVIGLSELTLGNGNLDIDTYSNLEKINNAGSTLLSTVNDILDISKIEAGRFELIPVDYDIPSLINDAVTQSIMRIDDKPIKFVLSLDENIPARLYGDDLRIKQMLNNLLSNAFKYTREGTVELRIFHEREGDTVWIHIIVSDTGIGIRSKDMDVLFNDYSQIDSKSNRKIEGTGLGLPITKRIAEMMGGTISASSEYGKGSVFSIKIQQQFVTDTVIGPDTVKSLQDFRYCDQKRRRTTNITRIDLSYARVLVVDDVPTNLDVARGMLKPYNMKIDCVTNGQAAINAIREEKVRYNAILMDHMMPEMDGIEATKIIRREIGTEYAKTIPIIALTANAISGNEDMFLRNGFQAFISKPIDFERLNAVIKEWVRDKEAEKSLSDANIVDENTAQTENLSLLERRSGIDRRKLMSHVTGIDVNKGINRFGGDFAEYVKILRSYAVNTRPLLDQIRTVTPESLHNYAIIVHGLKSSSRSISADDTGTQAEYLESRAKAGDLASVQVKNPAFLEHVEKLLSEIDGALAKIDDTSAKPIRDMPDMRSLTMLLAACEKFEMDTVDEIMDDIEAYHYESDDGLAAWIRENVDRTNFAEIAGKLREILTGTGQKDNK